MKMFALISDQETAASETAICGECRSEVSETEARLNAHNDVKDKFTFIDCTGNDALHCIICGATSK